MRPLRLLRPKSLFAATAIAVLSFASASGGAASGRVSRPSRAPAGAPTATVEPEALAGGPGDPAPLARASALRAQGRYREAAAALAPSPGAHGACGGALESYCALYRGEALRADGQPREAAAEFARARSLRPNEPLATRALSGEAQALLAADEPAAAVLALREVTRRQPTPELLESLAVALERAGRADDAVAVWRSVWLTHPAHPASDRAAERLRPRAGALELAASEALSRAERLLAAGLAEEGLGAARLAQRAAKGPRELAQARMTAASALSRLKRLEEAREELAQAARVAAGSTLEPEIALLIGRSFLARQESRDEAQRSLDSAWRKFSPHPAALEAGFLAAWLRFNRGAWSECATSFDEWLAAHPGASKADEARWYAGFCRWLAGDTTAARAQFALLESSQALAPQGLYWRARASEPAEARELLRRLVRTAPTHWYAWLARERLAALGPASEPLQLTALLPPGRAADATSAPSIAAAAVPPGPQASGGPPRSGAAATAATEPPAAASPSATAPTGGASLRAARVAPRVAVPEDRSAEARASAALPRCEREALARQLVAAGLTRDALAELEQCPKAKTEDEALHAASFADSLGLHGRAYRIANARLAASALGRGRPEALALLFPRAYRAEVDRSAAAAGIDPYFVWAIMRRESAFQPLARSAAQAQGLMQLLLPTARRIACIAGTEPPDVEALQRPEGSLPLASWYLAELAGRFRHAALTAAAYNAGPSAAASWVEDRRQRPLDEFVELIPFRETRHYVKGVVGDYLTYRALYREAGSSLPVGFEIPPATAGVSF